jgi:hypothetical protein
MIYSRSQESVLAQRLDEPRRFIQVVTGPRQVGKTTLVRHVVDGMDRTSRYASADAPGLQPEAWIGQQWDAARIEASQSGAGAILVLDEVQKIPGWSGHVKRLWDEDTAAGRPLHVVLLGSAPLVLRQGLAESLAGRFELIHLAHWSFDEMRDAFGFSLDDYLYFGGYPGPADLRGDVDRWARYVRDSIIETTVSRDVLLLTRVDKPALLRRLFELGCRYSGQILSYNKMLGQLQDAGNTVTLAHYLDLLGFAGMITGLPKYAGETVRRRASSPKLQAFTTSLVSAQSGRSPSEALSDPAFRGRLVESAVGAHLLAAAATGDLSVHYWRNRDREVDFVVERGPRLTAIEVKSGRAPDTLPGIKAFADAFRVDRTLLVGGDGIELGEFLSRPAGEWVA